MKTDISQTEILRRYLLEGLSEAESVAVEETFFTSDSAFDDLNAVEDELFFEYRAGELTPAERTVFESKYLRTREDRDRAAFAGAFLETTTDMARQNAVAVVAETAPGFFTSIAAFFNFGSVMQAGMAAALLLLAVGVVGLLVQNSRMRNDIAGVQKQVSDDQKQQAEKLAEIQRQRQSVEEQLAAERAKIGDNATRLQELETEKSRLQKEIDSKKQEIQRRMPESQPGGVRTIATLFLSPGLFTRSDGQPMNRIVLTPSAGTLHLGLELKSFDNYASFTARVASVDGGNTIFEKKGLRPGGNGKARSINLNVPAKGLSRADYEVTLLGVTANGESEEITRYYFSVDR